MARLPACARLLARLSPPQRALTRLRPRPSWLSTSAFDADSSLRRGVQLLDEGSVVGAIDEFKLAAAAGNAEGNFYLALAYDNLLGVNARGDPPVEPSPEAAFRCYQRAAEGGHAEAMLNLSFCFRDGEGVAQNIGVAFDWLDRCGKAGSARALFNAGWSQA